MLNATNRKKLAQALKLTGRQKVSDEEIEKAALKLIDGKKTRAELAEELGISVQTLSKRLHRLANPEEAESAEAAA